MATSKTASNKSILEFFKPKPVSKVPAPAPAPTAAPEQPTFQTPNTSRTLSAAQVSGAVAPPTRASSPPNPTASNGEQMTQAPSDDRASSLSPPPSTSLPEPPFSTQKENVLFKPPMSSSEKSSDRVIQNSDDEDSDSDSEIEDLRAILAARSAERARESKNDQTPSTPAASRQKLFNFHASPLAVLPKYKIDMKSLISHVQADEETENNAKKVKAMIEAKRDNDDDVPMFHEDRIAKSKLDHGALLDSVVADREDVDGSKVRRALMRTEATSTETRWYFFDTNSTPVRTKKEPFPVSSVPKSWKNDLVDPKMRHHTFLSGFAEDMVGFGNTLPDELVLWMLNEICYEPSDPLRTAYTNVLKASCEQVGRLVDPQKVKSLFGNLGATSGGTTVTEKIKPINKLTAPYVHRDWANLLSVVKLLGRLAKSMMLSAKTCTICILLRMSMDRLVCENIDILDAVQETINRICLNIFEEEEWTTCCSQICTVLFNSVSESTLRLQTVSVLSSITPRTHDLRRRLAMCFFFNSSQYAHSHSHTLMDLNAFIHRLQDPSFDTNSSTDYRELTALILLLDIALDDGRSTKLDLTDPVVEKKYNEDVDALSLAIKEIFNGIGNPGAAFISRIEAKEMLDLVSQRMVDTVRSKRKPNHTWFDADAGKEEDLQSERKGMASFVERMKGRGVSNGNRSGAK